MKYNETKLNNFRKTIQFHNSFFLKYFEKILGFNNLFLYQYLLQTIMYACMTYVCMYKCIF